MVKERTDNMRELFPAPPVLAGERLCLRPLAAPDAEGALKEMGFTRVVLARECALDEVRRICRRAGVEVEKVD